VIARIELEPDISDDVRQGAVQIAGFRLP
jgi:hypothetical protein